MFKLVGKEDSVTRKHNDSYSIKNYLTKDFNENFSFAVSELTNGGEKLTKSIASDRIYYFIEGSAKFIVDGKEMIVQKEDVLFIEKNTEYSFSGTFKAVLINIPAFSIENEIKIE